MEDQTAPEMAPEDEGELSLEEAVERCRARRRRGSYRSSRQHRRDLLHQWEPLLAANELFPERGTGPLPFRTLVAFDLECSGSAPDDIIEIGAVRVDLHTGRAHAFERLMRPRLRLNPHASEVTGLRASDLRGCPPLRDVLPMFLRFLGRSPVLGHAILNNDLKHLNLARYRYHMFRRLYAPRFIDTELLARRLFHMPITFEPTPVRFNLGDMLARYGLATATRHRALDDALATYRLLRALLDANRPGCNLPDASL